jgi:hypothetical protein
MIAVGWFTTVIQTPSAAPSARSSINWHRNSDFTLTPTRLTLPSGVAVDVDGVASGRSVLVEVFAHQGH